MKENETMIQYILNHQAAFWFYRIDSSILNQLAHKKSCLIYLYPLRFYVVGRVPILLLLYLYRLKLFFHLNEIRWASSKLDMFGVNEEIYQVYLISDPSAM